jgi:hypothetical protein
MSFLIVPTRHQGRVGKTKLGGLVANLTNNWGINGDQYLTVGPISSVNNP